MSLSFDATYYQATRPDVYNAFIATAGSTGLTWAQFAEQHYDTFGRFEGSDPSASFDTSYYLTTYPDVAAAGVNPFDHFLASGSLENRVPYDGFPTSSFVPADYAAANSDLAAAGITSDAALYQHFVIHGQFEGRSGTPTVPPKGGGTGSTFTLTTGVDAGADFTGGALDDTFIGTNTTLTPGDSLDGGAGNDTLRVATNITAGTSLAGFATQNIETIEVTADGTGGPLTFDVTSVSGATALNNVNSSQGLILQGMQGIVNVGLSNVSGGDTTITYDAPIIAGTSDTQNVTLENVNSLTNTAASMITSNGIEIFNVAVNGSEASLLTDFVSNTGQTLNVTGTQGLTIAGELDNFTTVNGSGTTGPLDVLLDDQNLTVTGGTGNDIFRTQAGDTFNNKDSFDGGDGTDTIFVDDAVAVAGAAGATFTNIEQLGINDAIDGTVDMDNWSGINKIISNNGVSSTTTINNVQDAFALDLSGGLGGGAFNVTIDHKTDTTSNTASLNVDLNGGSQTIGTLTLPDAETLSIDAKDTNGDATVDTFTINNLVGGDLNGATLNLTGDANITIGAATTGSLSKVEGGTSTGALNIAGLGGQNTAMTINTGSGNDTITGSTKADTVNSGAGNDTINASTGADTYTSGDGNDTFVYTAVGQSQGLNADTLSDFSQGNDVINLFGVAAGLSFLGNAANFTQAVTSLTGVAGQAVFDQGAKQLLVDVNGDGAIDGTADMVISLPTVTSLTAADLGLNGVTFTANKNGFNTNTAADSNEGVAVGPGGDTINATVTQINAGGNTIQGLGGADTLNVSGAGTAALNTNVFDTIETVVLAADTDGVNIDATDLSGAANTVSAVTGNAGKAQTLTIDDDAATADLKTALVTNVETLAWGNTVATDINVTIDEDSFAGIQTFQGSTDTADQLTLNGNAATDDFDFTSKVLLGVEILTVSANADQVTLDATDLLGGLTTINGAGTADLNLSQTSNLGPLTFGAAFDDLNMTTNNTALTIDDGSDVGNGFNDDLVGQGSNDLIAITGAGGTVNIDTFTGFDTVNAAGLVDGQTLDIDDNSTGDAYTVTLGVGDLDAGGSTSTDVITVNQGAVAANQTINTGAGNDIINAAGATVLTLDANGGNDTISLGANLTTADSIDGGTGTDILNVTNDTATSDLDNVRNIETLNITNTGASSYTLADATFTSNFTINALGGANAVTIDGSAETASAMTYNGNSGVDTITGTDVADTINGNAGNDILDGHDGTDTINGGAGNDTVQSSAGGDNITLGADNDIVILTTAANTYTAGVDVITDYVSGAGASNDLIRLDLTNANTINSGTTIAALAAGDAGDLVILNNSQTTAEITGSVGGNAAADAAIVVFNSSTGRAEIWIDTDSDWTTAGDRQQVATIDSITTLVGVQGLSATDGVDFDVT